MKNTILKVALLAAFAAAGAVRAEASVVISSVSAAGVVVISTPSGTNAVTIIKGCRLCNDTAVNTCVRFNENGTMRFQLCASSYSCSNTPTESNPNPLSRINGLAGFLGENLQLTGAFIIAGSTPGANAAGGMSVVCGYEQPFR